MRSITTTLAVLLVLALPAALRAQDVDQDGDGCSPNQGDCNDDFTPCHATLCDPLGGPYVHHCVCGRTRGFLTRGAACPGIAGILPPGAAPELCDGVDNNCAGGIDEGLAVDADGDGVRACNTCNAPAAPLCDCDDGRAAVKPGATEVCDALDNNCDGYTDADGSGTTLSRACYTGPVGTENVGPCHGGTQQCNASSPGVASWTTCSGEVVPSNPPAQPETVCNNVDDDCDGTRDDGLKPDVDGDTYQACGTCNAPVACDCDDNRSDVNPGRTEVCDAVDHDCDGTNNNGVAPRLCFEGANVTPATYTGDCPNHLASCSPRGDCRAGTQACTVAGAWGTCGGTLVLPAHAPASSELVCDGHDEDCDGTADDGLIVDADGDTHRACGSCGAQPPPACDCDDTRNDVYPGRAEVCDAVDHDCDGSVNNGVAPRLCFEGANVTPATYTGDCPNHLASCDPRGVCEAGTQACTSAGAWGTCGGALVLPAHDPALGESVCNGLDEDCDGTADDGLTVDADADGVRACGSCSAPAPYSCDCDDGNNAVRPGATEVCDGVNNDCDAFTDERDAAGNPLRRYCYGGPAGTWSGSCAVGALPFNCTPYGECRRGYQSCSGGLYQGACDGEVLPTSTPADTEASHWQQSPCDGRDNDCDNAVDDGYDADGDGVGRCDATPGDGCTTRLGAANCDCDDADRGNFPGNAEICDGRDNDCDGLIDETFDMDGDGFLTCSGCTVSPCDCNDGNNAIYPGAPELCNCVDEDCDGQPWNGFVDQDGDLVPACAGTECDDSNSQRYGAWCGRPARVEACDALDNDCDSSVDENLSRACYTGPANTNGIGLCHGGTQQCNATVPGTPSWSACNGEVVPANPPADPETVCDNQDEDCDGTADDGLRIDADSDGVRACGTCGAPAAPGCDCDDGDPGIKPGVAETCDAVDRNCDGSPVAGVADRICFEGTHVTPATYTGDCPGHAVSCQPRGACHVGSQSCQAGGTWSACGGALVLPTGDPALGEALCDNRDNDCDGTVDDGAFDADGDGARSCALCAHIHAMSCDCDDARVDVKPGGVEVCDGADNDCNGSPDDDGQGGVLSLPCYTGQPPETAGVGLCTGGAYLCDGAAGYSTLCTGEVTPAASDPCDGYDNDCNGVIDDGFDRDQDGVTTCAGDCNDSDPEMFPGNLEICDNKDNDCDGDIDGNLTACYAGPSGTLGVGECVAGLSECRSGVPVGECVGQVVPSAEQCDDLDNDCDGDTDEDFDQDRDGYRDCAACSFLAPEQCDCADGDPHNHPGSVEFCDCQDNDCDSHVDEDGACEGGACHDLDQDGYRNCDGDCDDRDVRVGPGFAEIWGNGVDDDCDGAVDEDVDEDRDGVTIGQGDCDDRFAEIHPGAAEVCDGFDNNCDGVVDEGFDQDGDHATTCGGDCDDTDLLRSPLLPELCGDGKDNDCDGQVDEDTDVDGDGVSSCGGDCNDHNGAVHGAGDGVDAAPEVCDGQDNNCDGRVDEGFDQDGDRFATCLGDCDDGNPEVNPARLEIAGNGLDDDCDGQVDEGEADLDGDGFSPNCGDCDDQDPLIHPHAEEACDRIDNNCDGYVDARLGQFDLCATCFDADADGWSNCDGDCDDSQPTVYPGAPEVCDLLDNDCDHSVDLDAQGLSVCTVLEDGGVEDAPAGDASVVVQDGGPVVLVDAGADAGSGEAQGVLRLGCGCGALGPGSWRGAVLALGLLGFGVGWRRRRRGLGRAAIGLGLCGLLLGGTACDSRVVVPGVLEPAVDAGGAPGDGGAGDRGGGRDADPGWDQGARDRWVGDLTTTACPVDGVIAQTESEVPGSLLRYAVPPATDRVPLQGVEAFALDDLADDVLGFVLRQPLPAGTVVDDEAAVSALALDEVQALDNLPAIPQASARIEAHRRVLRDLFGRIGVTSVQNLSFPSPVNSAHVRRAALAALAHLLPGDIDGLPAPLPTATVATEHVVQLLHLVSAEGVLVVLATTPAAAHPHNRILMNDLTNATHVGMAGYRLRRECEVQTLPELRADFLWVIDNSASMQEEQQALSAAAGAFYGALVQSGLDFRLGVVTTDGEVLQGGGFTTDLATFENNVRVGINGNGRELGLEYGLRAIEAARAATDPARQLRAEAALVVIFVSDEDSTNLRSVPAYAEAYRTAGAQVSAIVGPRPWGCQRVGLGVARPGHSYIEVAEATGGATGSICNPNLVETITAILIGAAGAASRSPLLRQPVSNSLAVRVERPGGLEAAARSRAVGFDYEPGANSILFFGDLTTLPPAGSRFEVAYQYFAFIEG